MTVAATDFVYHYSRARITYYLAIFFFYQQSVNTITTINDSNNDNDSNIAVIMKRGQRAEGDEC